VRSHLFRVGAPIGLALFITSLGREAALLVRMREAGWGPAAVRGSSCSIRFQSEEEASAAILLMHPIEEGLCGSVAKCVALAREEAVACLRLDKVEVRPATGRGRSREPRVACRERR